MRQKTNILKDNLRKLWLLIILIMMAKANLNAKLIGYWKFDENAGDIAHDYSEKGNCGYIRDVAWAEEGKIGNALKFNGRGYVEISGRPFSGVKKEITISMWLYGTSDPGTSFIFDGRCDNDRFRVLWAHVPWKDSNVWWHTGSRSMGRDEISKAAKTNEYRDRWNHWVFTKNSETGRMRIYLNGALWHEETQTRKIIDEVDSFKIGSEADEKQYYNSYIGLIDEVAIFDQELDAHEINTLYNLSAEFFIAPELKSLIKTVNEAQMLIERRDFTEAITFIKQKITKFQKEQKDINEVRTSYRTYIQKLYFLLGKASAEEKVEIEEIINFYKLAGPLLIKEETGPFILCWLFENTSLEDYKATVKNSLQNTSLLPVEVTNFSKKFLSIQNWPAFKNFLDVMLYEIGSNAPYIKAIIEGLSGDETWSENFLKYCQQRPSIINHYFDERLKLAEQHAQEEDYQKAIEVYQDIVIRCPLNESKAFYEFRLYECLTKLGRHKEVLDKIDDFIRKYKAIEPVLVKQAISIKGQTYIQQGQLDKAADTFLTLMIEYPDTKQASDANFFIGYCYALQRKFEQAKDAFNIILKNDPDGHYAAKARLYMQRMEGMTE